MPAAKITTVGIVSKPRSEEAVRIVPELVAWLAERRCQGRRWTEEFGRVLAGAKHCRFPRDQVPEGAQLLIVLGGDGTLLSAARARWVAATFLCSP